MESVGGSRFYDLFGCHALRIHNSISAVGTYLYIPVTNVSFPVVRYMVSVVAFLGVVSCSSNW